MSDIDRFKIERLYGLLWHARTDRTTFSGLAVSEARKLALSLIDKDGQSRGIEWARREIEKSRMDQPPLRSWNDT
jgi:hypothetical protein